MSKSCFHAGMLLLSAMTNAAYAGGVTIPNTFTAGTPAKAEDVNSNFSAVAAAINGSAQDITTLQTNVAAIQSTPTAALVVSVAGSKLGSLFSADYSGCLIGPIGALVAATTNGGDIICEQVVFITSKGYFAGVSVATALPSSIYPAQAEGTLEAPSFYFDQANCTGNAYIGFSNQWLARQGYVVAAANPADSNQSYSVQGTPVSVTIASVQTPAINGNGTLGAPACSNTPYQTSAFNIDRFGTTLSFYAVVPNNPNVTGVPKLLSGAVTVSIQ